MWPTSIGPAHILGGGTKFETFFCVCVGPLRFFTGGPSNGTRSFAPRCVDFLDPEGKVYGLGRERLRHSTCKTSHSTIL